MTQGEWLFSLGLALLVAAFCLLQAGRYFRRARLIEDMPTSRIRSAAQGFVELVGLVCDRDGSIPSPLTGTPCVWWRYRIERYRSNGRNRRWETVSRGESGKGFLVTDGSGHCWVDPDGAEIEPLHRKTWYGSTPHPMPGAGPAGWVGRLYTPVGGQRYRYREWRIQVGDPVYLLGHFETDATGRRFLTVDQLSAEILRGWKQDRQELLRRFDRNGDGEVCIGEWQQARQVARREALGQQRYTAEDAVEHLLRKPDGRGLPYVISVSDQRVISIRWRRRALLFATAFLVAAVFAGGLLLRSVDRNADLAEEATLLHQPQRVAEALERIHLIHHWTDAVGH